MTAHDIPHWVRYPEDDWVEIGPQRAGLEPEKLDQFMRGLEVRGASFGGEDHSGNAWSAVITWGGHLVHSWGTDTTGSRPHRRARLSSWQYWASRWRTAVWTPTSQSA